ncbi:MAG TPA: hypothetical protein PKM27_15065 [Saprospiraceae bacterium]|nr:hypothetical protein [Saprospiraceae bacterium]HNT20833.1 hypothetical protein [Saprospiraceae bacterium]
MFQTNSLWVEIAVVSIFYLLGHIFMGHFAERDPKWRKFAKYLVTLVLVMLLSTYFGRSVSMTVLGLSLLPILYIHAVILPRKGINGWTGEPKSRYYDFRGWNKDIFGTGRTPGNPEG